MTGYLEFFKCCPHEECGVEVGERHNNFCGIARCKEHGSQAMSCVEVESCQPCIFDGYIPGSLEAASKGWYAKRALAGKGWIQCAPDEEGAFPDINRAMLELTWDSMDEKFK